MAEVLLDDDTDLEEKSCDLSSLSSAMGLEDARGGGSRQVWCRHKWCLFFIFLFFSIRHLRHARGVLVSVWSVNRDARARVSNFCNQIHKV